MKTDSTSWSQLSAQIDQYRKRARHNLQKYQKNRFNCLYKKKKEKSQTDESSELIPEKLGYSMNLIRQKQQEEKLKSSMIVNKINYLKVQRDRKVQSTERARNKLERVFSIRSSSSQDKQLCKKEIKAFSERNHDSKRQISERVKSERAKIQQERHKILSQNSYRAKKTREQRIVNEQTILQQKEADIAEKQKIVSKVQEQIETCLQKKKIRQKQVIEAGKANHSNHIRNEFFKYQKMKKMNQQMMTKFSIETAKIMEETEKAHQNLMTFEYYLMMRKKPNHLLGEKTPDKIKPVTPFTNHTVEQRNAQKSEKKNVNNFFELTN